ncbi:hypothetical protein [Streptomyces noursei]|uniref:hypothetical protein n=1 Tax=Streptomyces noursei TaxID=1971 RepID=UPI0021A8954D|nr:hypothetical protein [Streptomyces noursei]UWS77578.1 hypothetical protein N1H47_40545 [Streptomyces noursei]
MKRNTRKGAAAKVSRPGLGAGTPAAEPSGSWRLNPSVIAGKRGWPGAGRGRAANIDKGAVYISTTVQTAGLYPFVLGAGLPAEGVPLGADLLTNELVCFDPAGWVGSLLTNPGVWIQSQPGVGKSAIAKRICLVYAGYGFKTVVPGDVKGEYAPLVRGLGGQVVRIGRGLDRLNPSTPARSAGSCRPCRPPNGKGCCWRSTDAGKSCCTRCCRRKRAWAGAPARRNKTSLPARSGS